MNKFPRIAELGIEVKTYPSGGIRYVDSFELRAALGGQLDEFNELFGVQTMCVEGPYARDVEAVLERMVSGKLQGSQKEFD